MHSSTVSFIAGLPLYVETIDGCPSKLNIKVWHSRQFSARKAIIILGAMFNEPQRQIAQYLNHKMT
jgi:hypothetical protein